MKLKTRILLLTISILPLLSCNGPTEESATEQQQEKKANLQNADLKATLKEINDVLDKAILEGDYETILKYYTDDVTIVPVFNPAIKGKNALREEYKKNNESGVKYHAFNAELEKMWFCGDEVFEYGKYGLAVSSKETEYPYAYYGSYFMIWDKQPDRSYLIKYLITNLDHKPYKYYE